MGGNEPGMAGMLLARTPMEGDWAAANGLAAAADATAAAYLHQSNLLKRELRMPAVWMERAAANVRQHTSAFDWF